MRNNTDAWNNVGQVYYSILVLEYVHLWNNVNFMAFLVKHWQTYNSRHLKRTYKWKRPSASAEVATEVVNKTKDVLIELPEYRFEISIPPPLE